MYRVAMRLRNVTLQSLRGEHIVTFKGVLGDALGVDPKRVVVNTVSEAADPSMTIVELCVALSARDGVANVVPAEVRCVPCPTAVMPCLGLSCGGSVPTHFSPESHLQVEAAVSREVAANTLPPALHALGLYTTDIEVVGTPTVRLRHCLLVYGWPRPDISPPLHTGRYVGACATPRSHWR